MLWLGLLLSAFAQILAGCFAPRVDARVRPGLRVTARAGLGVVPPQRRLHGDGRVTGRAWREPFATAPGERLLAADVSFAFEHGWAFASGYGFAVGGRVPLPASAGLNVIPSDAAKYVALGITPTAYVQFPRVGRFTLGLGIDVMLFTPALEMPVTYSFSPRLHLTLTERLGVGVLDQLTTLSSQVAFVVDLGAHAALFLALAHHWSPFGYAWPKTLELAEPSGDVRFHAFSLALGITLYRTPPPPSLTAAGSR